MLDSLTTTIVSPRDEARELGIPWVHVLECAGELRRQAIEKREAMDGARRVAWESYCHWNGRSPGCHSFWRCGFDHVLGRLAESGRDFTSIRAYDEIADAVGAEFPEWAGRGDELWDWLATSYERLPTRERFINAAMEMLSRRSFATEVTEFTEEF